MTIELPDINTTARTLPRAVTRNSVGVLRAVAIAAGIIWSFAFVVAGLHYELQAYGDGSIFSYAVAVEDAWTFHWHNIAGRAFVYLFSMAPAEIYVALTRDAQGGVTLYGFLFFVAPLLGLIATFLADRSRGRVFFSYACFSTALICPLVFGFPTEMWMAHALFWPTLAVCHDPRHTGGTLLIFTLMLALVFTHAGALLFAFTVVASLWLRGARDAAFVRASGALFAALAIWATVKLAMPPDDYISAVLFNAALHAFDAEIFEGDLLVLIFVTVAGFGVILLALKQLNLPHATGWSALLVTAALALHWTSFDHGLHASNRYPFRTIVLIATPALGALAALYVVGPRNRLTGAIPWLPRLLAALKSDAALHAITAAFALVMLIHAIETAKFVIAWSDYKSALRAQAMGSTVDPALGDPQFVSSARLGATANRLAWSSTTPYLSILLAPKLSPARLVIDPTANYFWLSCATATKNFDADRAMPAESRRLIRILSCLHR